MPVVDDSHVLTAQAVEAMEQARSFTFGGTVRYLGNSYIVQMTVDKKGNCYGTYALEAQRPTGIMRTEKGEVFMQPLNGYWTGTTDGLKRGRWFEVEPGNERVNELCGAWLLTLSLPQSPIVGMVQPRREEASSRGRPATLITYEGGTVTLSAHPPLFVYNIASPYATLEFFDFNRRLSMPYTPQR